MLVGKGERCAGLGDIKNHFLGEDICLMKSEKAKLVYYPLIVVWDWMTVSTSLVFIPIWACMASLLRSIYRPRVGTGRTWKGQISHCLGRLQYVSDDDSSLEGEWQVPSGT